MQEMQNNMENNNSRTKIYEIGYLLVPTIAEEEVGAVYGNLKELISTEGGLMISDEMPKMINLAYQMVKVVQNVRNKFDSAYFGWFKFEMEADKILSLKEKLKLDPNIIRFLTLKTVRENTIASKRFVSKDLSKKRTSKEEGEVEPVEINKEEIDKEIDALVEA